MIVQRNGFAIVIGTVTDHQAIGLEIDGLDVLILLLAIDVAIEPLGKTVGGRFDRLAAWDQARPRASGICSSASRSKSSAGWREGSLKQSGLSTLRFVVGKILKRA